MNRLALLLALAPTLAFSQPKKPVKDIVQPVRIEKLRPAGEIGDELESAILARDAKATAALFRDRFFMRGMWFPDAACTKRFAKERVIERAERIAFARCLAKLEPQLRKRISADPDGYVLTFAPGVEVELGIAGEIYYVGMLHAKSRRDVPTLSVAAFEALRTAGSTNVDDVVAAKLDPEVKKRGHQVAAWLEICVNAKGATTVEVSEASSPEIGEVFKAATKDWAFAPFVHANKPIAVCSQTLLTYPAAKAPQIEVLPSWEITPPPDEGVEGGVAGGVAAEWTPGVGFAPSPPPPPPPPPPPGTTSSGSPAQNVAPTLLEGQRIAGEKAIVPDDLTKAEMAQSGKDKFIGSFKLCVDPQGKVTNVTRLKSTGFEMYDKKILTEMRTNWAYRPYMVNGKAVPVCTAVTFIYSQPPSTPPSKRR